MTNALALVHSDETVVRSVTQEQAYANLLAAIFEPTIYTTRKPNRRLTAV